MLVKVATSNAVKKKYSSIGIVGAGLGGLTTANALLHKENLVGRVQIFDKAAEFYSSAGAGFTFSPNGQICLSSIGITEFHRYGHPFHSMARLDQGGTKIRFTSDSFRDLREKYGFGFYGLLRSDVVDILMNQFENTYSQKVNYSHNLIRITPVQDKVELEFENGHTDVFDLVIGADGINSAVARLLQIDDMPPIYSKANIFYGKIPRPDKMEYFQTTDIFKEHTLVDGPGTGRYVNFFVGAGEKKHFLWANTYASNEPPPKRKEWTQGEHRKELEGVLAKYPTGHAIHDLANLTSEENLMHFGLYYRHHKSTWTNDRVVLLGDACHATLPYVGQGANQAIEDAITLALCLEHHDDYKTAYEEYYKIRFPRTKRIVGVANLLDKLLHSNNWFVKKGTGFLNDSFVRGGAVFKQLEKEILEECPVKDYKQYIPK